MICDYCNSKLAEGEMKCDNCGAPIVVDPGGGPDYRHCPVCHRRLLALGSPACSYCGRRLPPDYIKARESDLHRVTGLRESGELVGKVDELIRENARKERRHSSFFGLFDVSSFTDFFD